MKTFNQFIAEEAWQKKEGKNKSGGLNEKGRKSYERACLLYTSPSPRDRTRSRMPSSA